MKYLVLIVFAVFLSCSLEKGTETENLTVDFENNPFPQKWQLKSMSGNMSNSQTSGEDMHWQEYYILNADDTFEKVRDQGGLRSKSAGTFTIKTAADGEYLELIHDFENGLIGNCTSETTETLYFTSADKLQSTWWACDGPGLFYEKVEMHN